MKFTSLKKRFAERFLGKTAEQSKNDYITAFHREFVQEMELDNIDSDSPMTEIKAWVMRQSDAVVYQLSKGVRNRLPGEDPEVFAFRCKCQRALSQMVRDRVINIKVNKN